MLSLLDPMLSQKLEINIHTAHRAERAREKFWPFLLFHYLSLAVLFTWGDKGRICQPASLQEKKTVN